MSTQHPPVHISQLLQTPHGMFSRVGGKSLEPFSSLNISLAVGDNPETVCTNRQSILNTLGLPRLVAVKQVHGDKILLVGNQHSYAEAKGYDAMICNLAGVGLLIQQADCQAILLHDPVKSVIAAIHCGWRGSVADIITKTISALNSHFAVNPADLHAAISPSLGPCCAEFVNFASELPAWMHAYQPTPAHFDFWAISSKQLTNSGVLKEHIDVAGICTKCNLSYFSFRRAKKDGNVITGRNGSIIGLPLMGGGTVAEQTIHVSPTIQTKDVSPPSQRPPTAGQSGQNKPIIQQVNYYKAKLYFEIDSWDLAEAIRAGKPVVIIDTRCKEAFDLEHIPGAISFPHREITEESTANLDSSALYVTYCDGIGCNASTKGALRLATYGFKVKELLGGLDWWRRDGYETEGRNAASGTAGLSG